MLSGIARPLQLVYVRSLVTGSSFQKLLLEHLAAQIKCAGHLTSHYGANKKGRARKNWCFQTVVLEKAPVSPLDYKEIKPVNLKRNQPWLFIGRTDAEAPILWPPDRKSQLIAAAAAKSLQSCPTLCDPIDSSPPGSSVPGILQARILGWVAISLLEKTLMLGKIEGRRRRGPQRIRWLDDITDSMDMNLANSGRWGGTGKPGVL